MPEFKSGDLVFAKVGSKPLWPSKVKSVGERKLQLNVFLHGL